MLATEANIHFKTIFFIKLQIVYGLKALQLALYALSPQIRHSHTTMYDRQGQLLRHGQPHQHHHRGLRGGAAQRAH